MIEMLWPTPVLRQASPWAPDELEALRLFTVERFDNHKANPPKHALPDIDMKLRTQLNLFSEEHERGAPEVWSRFRAWVDTVYRDYIREAYRVRNAHELAIEARCIPVCYKPGMRAQPHYHHTCDHVLCLYLDCGYDRTPYADREKNTGDGELVLQDPRPMAGFPFWEKTKYIETTPGLVVLHPSRIWHETNAFNAKGKRVLLVVTLHVVSHNYLELYEPLGSPQLWE